MSTQTSKLRCPPPLPPPPPTWMVCRLGDTPVRTRRGVQRRARAEAATLRSNTAPGSHPAGGHGRAETPEGPLAVSLLRPGVRGTSGILEAQQLKWKPSSLLPRFQGFNSSSLSSEVCTKPSPGTEQPTPCLHLFFQLLLTNPFHVLRVPANLYSSSPQTHPVLSV